MYNKRNSGGAASGRLAFVLMAIVGLVLFLAAVFFAAPQGLNDLYGLGIGFGAALLCLGIGNLIQSFVSASLEGKENWKEIEVNDERNIQLREKAGYQTSRVMNYALCAALFILGILHVQLVAILLVAVLLVLQLVLFIALSNYYSKRM